MGAMLGVRVGPMLGVRAGPMLGNASYGPSPPPQGVICSSVSPARCHSASTYAAAAAAADTDVTLAIVHIIIRW